MSHTVVSCPLTKSDGRLKKLHTADDESVDWLSSYSTYCGYANKWIALNPSDDESIKDSLCFMVLKKSSASHVATHTRGHHRPTFK